MCHPSLVHATSLQEVPHPWGSWPGVDTLRALPLSPLFPPSPMNPAMKTLILMRHAKATWDHDQWPDFDRPLNAQGELDAPRMGRRLVQHGMLPDAILCSSARRTMQTADLVAAEFGSSDRIQQKPELYLCPVSVWEYLVHRLHEAWGCVLCVGHNNGLEDLVSHLLRQRTPLPTAGVVVIDLPQWAGFDRSTSPLRIEVWHPDEPW